MIEWSKLPDLGAVALLTCAFASVVRRENVSVSGLWLTGWMMIAVHFAALLFAPVHGLIGTLSTFTALAALAWAGVLFMTAAAPYRSDRSALWKLWAMLFTYTVYIGAAIFAPGAAWALIPAAALFALAPFTIAVLHVSRVNHPMRWINVVLHSALAFFLLAQQLRPGSNPELALDVVFFTAYFGCALQCWYIYPRLTGGAFVTTFGFLTWASVFLLAPTLQILFPTYHIENEVWNLPKYVVAVGMILLVLEEQIEHNKHLALHDDLTGLPNRRLFQDRLGSALERARRTRAHAALLLVDLDHFKQVNDTVGHHVGDLVLQRASHIFLGRVRRSDTVARTGGDEFSIILEEPTCRDEARVVGDALVELLNQPLQIEGHTIQIGASVGIAIFPDDASSGEALRIAADRNMYVRKRQSHAAEKASFPSPFPPVEAQTGRPAWQSQRAVGAPVSENRSATSQ